MKELIIEFGNDTLGETRMYQRNPKGYEQAVKDMKLYKAQQKAEIDYLKYQIKAECKKHQEAMKEADKTIKRLKLALELACSEFDYNSYFCCKLYQREGKSCTTASACKNCYVDYFKTKAEEMMKSE